MKYKKMIWKTGDEVVVDLYMDTYSSRDDKGYFPVNAPLNRRGIIETMTIRPISEASDNFCIVFFPCFDIRLMISKNDLYKVVR